MEKFIWDEKYSVGIPLVDKQHKIFFRITNRMIGLAERKDPNAEALVAIVGELRDYAMYHFLTEERHFARFTFERSEEHMKAHDLYRKRITSYWNMTRHQRSDLANLVQEIAAYSVYWLSDHILIMDKNIPYSVRKMAGRK